MATVTEQLLNGRKNTPTKSGMTLTEQLLAKRTSEPIEAEETPPPKKLLELWEPQRDKREDKKYILSPATPKVEIAPPQPMNRQERVINPTSKQRGRTPHERATRSEGMQENLREAYPASLASFSDNLLLNIPSKTDNIYSKKREESPIAYGIGSLAGQAGRYMGASAIAPLVPGLNKIANPFIRNQATDLLVDNIAQTPATITKGIAEGKGIGGIAKDVAKQNALDLGLNVTIGLLGNAVKKYGSSIVKRFKEGKVTPQEAADIIKELNLPKGTTPETFLKEMENLSKEIGNKQVADQVEAYYKSFETPSNITPPIHKEIEGKTLLHGTNSKFDKFDLEKVGSFSDNEGLFGTGIYLTENPIYAKVYGENVLNVKPTIEKPFIIDRNVNLKEISEITGQPIPNTGIYDDKASEMISVNPRLFTQKLKDLGYDSVIVKGGRDQSIQEMVVFDPKKLTIKTPKIESPKLNSLVQDPLKSPVSDLKPLNNSLPLPTNKKPLEPILKPKEDIVSSNKEKTPFKQKLRNFYRRIVDSNSALKGVDEDTFVLATNAKKTGGTVNYILQEGLVDMQGNKVGKSLKEVVEKIPQEKYKDFWYYYLHKHNIDRAREGKNVFSEFTPEMSERAAKEFELLNPEFSVIQKDINNFIRTFTSKWSNEAGLIDDELFKILQETYPNYVPTNRSFSTIENAMPNTQGRGFVNQSSGIKRATGSARDITDPTENIMEMINRTVRTAKYNQVGQSLADALKKEPDKLKQFAEVLPDGAEINSNVDNIVTVLEKGKKVNIQVNDKTVLDALKRLNESNLDDVDNFAKKLTNAFKSLITQKNPIFAIRNISRDIPTAYINSETVKNPVQFFGDLGKATKDVKVNAPLYQQYKALGGQSSNFFDSNNVSKSVKELTNPSLLKRFTDKVEGFNNVTEVVPRYAEFKRVFEQTGDIQKALYASGEVTTNFARGGDITKKIDAYVPYLNASVQGLDKLVRQFKNRPIATVLKGATIVTAPTLILNHFNKDNPNYKQLDNRTKDNNFLIPREDGTFIKIPKSREYGVLFAALTERILSQVEGNEDSWKGFGNTVATNFSPANPVENNIFSPLAYNLPKNQDFAGRSIVPLGMKLDNRSPRYQYDEKTSAIGKVIGDKLNFSPKQIDYLIRSYTGVIGQLLLPVTTKYNYNGKTTAENLLKPVTLQFKADPLYSNQSIKDFYDNYDKLKRKAADKNIKEGLPSKLVTPEEKLRNEFAKISNQIGDINDRIRVEEQKGNKAKVQELRREIIKLTEMANSKLKEVK